MPKVQTEQMFFYRLARFVGDITTAEAASGVDAQPLALEHLWAERYTCARFGITSIHSGFGRSITLAMLALYINVGFQQLR